ncbi:group 3 secretory phospholipase A2 [Pelodytes ibericus]
MWKGCVLVGVHLLAALVSVSGKESKARHRRSWLMPGTLWCGTGSAAENYTNLGLFQGVDLCCRDHDYCTPQIQSFEYQYGFRNYRLHTVSHCDCDQRFRTCLHALNDTVSTLVGIMYFNIFEAPCFTLHEEEHCSEWHWWGGCKKYGLAPMAELHKQTPFNYSEPEGTHNSISTTLIKTNTLVTPHRGRGKHNSKLPTLETNMRNRRRLLKKQKKALTRQLEMERQSRPKIMEVRKKENQDLAKKETLKRQTGQISHQNQKSSDK